MSGRQCGECGSTEADTDDALGVIICKKCGYVLEEHSLITSVQYKENSSGGADMVGQFVSSEGGKGFIGSGFSHGFSKSSREATLKKGRLRIDWLGSKLKLYPALKDTAYGNFKLAVSRGLTRGRKSDYVAAACLYIACRLDRNNSLLLLDFTDVLQTDVYTLGRVYLQLAKEFRFKIPALDPCLYVDRFSEQLEFGDKTRQVANIAMRLVARMKRDWMAEGRRPTGLCGAALLVAARIFNFNRTIKDIIPVVRIGEGTIKKRLLEFEKTESGQMTINEFRKVDLETEMDPPSFTEGQRKAKMAKLEEQGELPSHLTEEVARLESEIEQAIVGSSPNKNRRYKKFLKDTDGDDCSSICSVVPSLSDLDDEIAHYTQLLEGNILKTALGLDDDDKEEEEDDDDDVKAMVRTKNEESSERNSEECASLDSLRMPPPSYPLGPRPTAASLGIKESIEVCLKTPTDADVEEVDDKGELDLTDINDEEIDSLILSEEEVKIKTTIWMRENADFLVELKEKEERKAKELLEHPELKKKKPRKRRPKTEAQTAGEAIGKMLQEKKISSKINYEVLMDLNRSCAMSICSEAAKAEETSTKEESSHWKRSAPDELDIPKVVEVSEKKPRMDELMTVERSSVGVAEDDNVVEEDEEDWDEEEEEENTDTPNMFGQNIYDEYDDYEPD